MKSQSSFSKQNIYKCLLAALAGFLLALVFKILIKVISIILLVVIAALFLGEVSSWQRNKYSK